MAVLDEIDRKLLTLIQRDGRAPYAELGGHVGLSVSAVNERLKKLSHAGALIGYSAKVDPTIVGQRVLAFVVVHLETLAMDREFLARIGQMPQIQECHRVAGEDAWLMKVRATDNDSLNNFISSELPSVPGVVRIRTMMALATAKETSHIDCQIANAS